MEGYQIRDLIADVAAKRLIDISRLPFQRKPGVAIVLVILGLPRLRQNSHRALIAAVSAFDGEGGGAHSAIIRQNRDAHRPQQRFHLRVRRRSAL